MHEVVAGFRQLDMPNQPSEQQPSSSSSQQHPSLSAPLTSWTSSPSYSHYYNSSTLGTDFSVLSKNPLLNRIGLEPLKRITLITASASFWGFILGGVIGSRQSGMQYLAENAHRLPKTTEGWYFYHKKKNYRMIYGALSKGAVYSAKTGAMVALFEALEASADFYRGGADLFNSVGAGLASGGIFSVASKFFCGVITEVIDNPQSQCIHRLKF